MPLMGERLIVAYKLTKGSIQTLAALALALVPGGELSAAIGRFALLVQEHVSAKWAYLIDTLVDGVTPSRVKLAIAAIAADGLFTLLEGWSLWRRKPWAPWFVVVATGGFIPLEIVLLVEHPTILRSLLLLINAATVAYLVHGRLRRRARAADSPDLDHRLA